MRAALWIIVPMLTACGTSGFGARARAGEEGEGEGEGGEGEGEGPDLLDRGIEESTGAGTDTPFDPANANGLSMEDDGTLSLGGGRLITENTVIWVANSQEGTVSKLDTRTRLEVGRYWTDSTTGGGNPSRTTVNSHGDVVVSNRNTGISTKILASDCPDLNGSGTIETSSGGGDVFGWGSDECIAWSTVVGAGARGSAVEERPILDGGFHEYVWVGAYSEGVLHEVDGETGALTGRSVGGVTPYGAAMGPGGILWTQAGQALASIDTTTLAMRTFPLPGGESWYGLTVDGAGRVWIGGSVARFDPATETWASPDASVRGAGIAADSEGHVWTGSGTIFKIDAETLEHTTIATGGSEYGWAVDFDGFVWGVNISHNTATVIDPSDDSFVLVSPPFNYPYTYSDMTGFQMRNAVQTNGQYRHLASACEGANVDWLSLSWDVDAPAGTRIVFAVRTGATADALFPAQPLVVAEAPGDDPPVALGPALEAAGVTPGTVLSVTATLERLDPEAETPRLRALTLVHECPESLQ
jgi:hypothetical protein